MGKRASDKLINASTGWPGKQRLAALETPVQVGSLTPQQFWQQYISKRQPVVIQGELTDISWRQAGAEAGQAEWSDAWLAEHAGASICAVEARSSAAKGYGQGRTKKMRFAEFLARLRSGDTSLYLSSQQQPLAEDGFPELLAPPLSELGAHLPLRPSLMGNLVPQQLNMWMGYAGQGPRGSSSGLHHDFHDNLYLLLRGRKRFRLYPPSEVERMYVRGKPLLVHPNGRIVYQGQGDVLPDGSDAADVACWNKQRKAEQELAAAEAAVAAGEAGAQQRLAKAEAGLVAALDAALDAAGWEEAEGDGYEGLSDDYQGSDQADDSDSAGSEDSGGLQETAGADWDSLIGGDEGPVPAALQQDLAAAEAAVAAGRPGARQQLERAEAAVEAALEAALTRAGATEGSEGSSDEEQEDEAEQQEKADEPPPSFSLLDLSLPDAELQRRFPKFPGTAAALTVELQAGQMLYLPAGWFHEVTSFSNSKQSVFASQQTSKQKPDGSSSSCEAHLALNWWFHPPDNLEASPKDPKGFSQPYTSPFWPAVWERRQPALDAVAQHAGQPSNGKHGSCEGCTGEHQAAAAGRAAKRRKAAAAQQAGCHRAGLSQPEEAQIRRQLYGRMFGLGRRQHLVHFVGLRAGAEHEHGACC